jgi:hypothetical protein
MQLQAGEGDGLITPEDRDQMRDFVARVYMLMEEKNKFDYVLHPHGHSLQWSFAHRFMKNYL